MEVENYNYIADLDTIKDSWKLKVRILRLWKTTFQLDMIIMDERGDNIQATVKKALFPVFDNVLEEGMVVMVSKFGVGANNGRYPLLKHAYKVNFYRCTKVVKSVKFDGPLHGFKFLPFFEAVNNITDPDLPVDVIGCVLCCGNMEIYEKGEGKEGRRISLDLEDLDGLKLKCTLWDDFAEQFHNYVSTTQIENHVVIILQFGRIRVWRGIPILQNNLFGSRLFINNDISEIVDFRKKSGASVSSCGGSQLSSQRVNSVCDEFLNKTKKCTIDEIVDSTDPMVCAVLATIRSMEEHHGWYYVACRKHKTKVVKKSEFSGVEYNNGSEVEDDGSLYCLKCNGKASSVYPSYKLQMRVQDSTGTTSVVLFDRDVSKLLHISAFDLREKQETDGEGERFPDDFSELVDKKILFKIDVSKYNIDVGYQVYTVLKVCPDPVLISEFSKKYFEDQVSGEWMLSKIKMIILKLEVSSIRFYVVYLKDVVSCTADSSAVLIDDNESGRTPVSVKRPPDVSDKNVVQYSTSKKRTVAVKIEKD